MEEEITEQEETLNEETETPEETKVETEAPEETSEPEKAEESKKFQTIDAQKRYWRERAQKAEAKAKASKLPVSPSEEDPDFWKAKVDFLIQNPDKRYSEEEFDHVATVAARKGISLSEAAKSEDGYIQYQREKVANEKKIPGSTSPDFSSFEKKITKETPPEEIDKVLKERFKKAQETSKSI